MLKKISNVSKYSAFNFLFSFFSVKRFLIPFIVASFISFFSFFNLKADLNKKWIKKADLIKNNYKKI